MTRTSPGAVAGWTGLAAVVALGVAVRIPGLTDKGLWRDDAWTALTSRTGLGNAVRMSSTSIGFTLFERAWIGLRPSSSMWAQILPLAIGLAGIVATFALLRFWRLPLWLALAGALVVAVSPVAAQYSTHVKEYSTDLLLGCLVLWVGERARRSMTDVDLSALPVVSAAAMFLSASVAPVVAGAWAAVVLSALRAPRSPRAGRRILVAAAPLAALMAGLWAVRLRHLPGVLHRYWMGSGAFLDHSSLRSLWNSLSFAGSVVTLGLVPGAGHLDVYGDPIRSSGGIFWPEVILTLLLLAGVAAGGRAAPAGLAIVAALAASFAGVMPLGTGRADEAVYPAVILLAALGVEQIVQRAGRRLALWSAPRLVGPGVLSAFLGGFVAAALFSYPVRHPPRYPQIDVRRLAAYVYQNEAPGDLVLVDPYTRYPWDLYESRVVEARFGRSWGAGFTVASADPAVFISPSEPWEDGYTPGLWASDVSDGGRLWYVGTWFLNRDRDPVYRALEADGWQPQGEYDAGGGFVVLMAGGGATAAALLQAGNTAQAAGKYTVAIARYQAALEKDPSGAVAPFDLGVAYQHAGDVPDALSAYRRSVAADPSYRPALFDLAQLLTAPDPAEAAALYERLISLNPDQPYVELNLGLLLFDHGQVATGRQDVQAAIRLKPALAALVPKGVL